jgi:hypothetical protein
MPQNLYAEGTFASAICPLGRADGASWFDSFDQPVPASGGVATGVNSGFPRPHPFISLAVGPLPPANEDMLKRGSR